MASVDLEGSGEACCSDEEGDKRNGIASGNSNADGDGVVRLPDPYDEEKYPDRQGEDPDRLSVKQVAENGKGSRSAEEVEQQQETDPDRLSVTGFAENGKGDEVAEEDEQQPERDPDRLPVTEVAENGKGSRSPEEVEQQQETDPDRLSVTGFAENGKGDEVAEEDEQQPERDPDRLPVKEVAQNGKGDKVQGQEQEEAENDSEVDGDGDDDDADDDDEEEGDEDDEDEDEEVVGALDWCDLRDDLQSRGRLHGSGSYGGGYSVQNRPNAFGGAHSHNAGSAGPTPSGMLQPRGVRNQHKFAGRIHVGPLEAGKVSAYEIGATSVKECSRREVEGRVRVVDKSDRATVEQALDPRTRMVLFKMLHKGVFCEINGCISTGKEERTRPQ
ncbi:hypothetical protein CBR_g61468 [Chara braunii]|uniref:Uncharacterized protein n=1 Tax=Chara braunii TaxID=69332 RepID=A0A388K8M6_CHABU|nr:hypothetical protein CBR_g61468 [Chara braunii]|eukprot:GBG66424.1 hypothetical protein CBR_g61468 [Chara braunii]